MNDGIKDVNDSCEDLIEDNDKMNHRIEVLEEEIKNIRCENNELRKKLNAVIELNNVIDLLNARYDMN